MFDERRRWLAIIKPVSIYPVRWNTVSFASGELN